MINTITIILLTRGEVKLMGRIRKQWSTSTDNELHDMLKELSQKTRIPTTRLLDEAIEDLLLKYKVIKKRQKPLKDFCLFFMTKISLILIDCFGVDKNSDMYIV